MFNSRSLTVTIFLLLLTGWIGFLAGFQYQKTKGNILPSQLPSTSNSTPVSTSQTVKTSSIFRSQNATLQATVVDFKDNTLTLKNDKGQDSFKLTPQVQVFEFTDTTKPPVVSDVKNIKTDKEALVVLQLTGEEYQVISISYLPKTTPPPPPPKKP